jgi:hypothetical protein
VAPDLALSKQIVQNSLLRDVHPSSASLHGSVDHSYENPFPVADSIQNPFSLVSGLPVRSVSSCLFLARWAAYASGLQSPEDDADIPHHLPRFT